VLVVAAVYLGFWLRNQDPDLVTPSHVMTSIVYSVIVILGMVAMGVYGSHVREGYVGMMLRTAVAVFLIASMGSGFVFYFLPDLAI